MNLRGFTKRRRCVTTKRSTANPIFADVVKRRFYADARNQVYVGDITYLPCKNGTNMYLATVIDLYSRKLAGFAIADHLRTSLVIEALEHANTVRGGLDGASDTTPDAGIHSADSYHLTCLSHDLLH